MHTYHDGLKSFPPGNLHLPWMSIDDHDNSPGKVPCGMWGWALFILPFSEQQVLHSQFDFTKKSYAYVTVALRLPIFTMAQAVSFLSIEAAATTLPRQLPRISRDATPFIFANCGTQGYGNLGQSGAMYFIPNDIGNLSNAVWHGPFTRAV